MTPKPPTRRYTIRHKVCPICATITRRYVCPDCARRGLMIPTLTREQIAARLGEDANAGRELFVRADDALQRFTK